MVQQQKPVKEVQARGGWPMGWWWGLWLLQVTPPGGIQRQLSPDIHTQLRVLWPGMDGWDSKSDLLMFSEKLP